MRPAFLGPAGLGAWVGLWLVLLAAALAFPGSAAHNRVQFTIWLALLYYGLAVSAMSLSPGGEAASRWLWTLGCLAYLFHFTLALHDYHHGSHADAYERTERLTGFGPGIYISDLFTLVWSGDVLFWWLWPAQYGQRSRWATVLIHAFLGFVVFNGAVIFARGPVRWLSLALFGLVAILLVRRWLLAGARQSAIPQATGPGIREPLPRSVP
jgi:hypothetical protein